MKSCKMFYLKNCPYCKRAFTYLDELLKEEKYCNINIEKIEENSSKAIADSYDYYYVPCFYVDEQKTFEGVMNKDDVKEVLDKIIQKQ